MPHPEIIALVPELLAGIRIAEAAKAIGAGIRLADTPAELDSAIRLAAPSLIIIDLGYGEAPPPGALETAVRSGAPVIAFGFHTKPALLQAAREAGAQVYTRGQFLEGLRQILGGHAQPASSPAKG